MFNNINSFLNSETYKVSLLPNKVLKLKIEIIPVRKVEEAFRALFG